METSLRLLMRDGAVHVSFQPRLTAEQYLELLERVARATTKDDLRREMREAQRTWERQLTFDTDIE